MPYDPESEEARIQKVFDNLFDTIEDLREFLLAQARKRESSGAERARREERPGAASSVSKR